MPSQDKNPPFDIGSYGEQILETLSSGTDNTGIASFSEIVSGRPKYEVARTFSALLQLVTTFPYQFHNRAQPQSCLRFVLIPGEWQKC